MNGIDWLGAVQWPAMAVTVVASWLVASNHKNKRGAGFWLFLVSNAAWVAWGWHSNAYALILLQVCLAGMNIRGAAKASDEGASGDKAGAAVREPKVLPTTRRSEGTG